MMKIDDDDISIYQNVILKLNGIYVYKLASDISGLLISGKVNISGHKFPCSMNNENIFSS